MTVQEIYERLNSLNTQSSSLLGRTKKIRKELNGDVPENESDVGNAQSSDGFMANIAYMISEIHAKINTCHTVMNDVEKIFHESDGEIKSNR